MSMHYHIDRQSFINGYHHFLDWEHDHSRQLLWAATIVILSLLFVMAFVWLSRSSRIQIYDPLQLDDLFYPYMLTSVG